jgi:hypothetical protein
MRRHDSVIALKDGRVLGTLEAYIIGPGWLDRYVIAVSGFSFSPWICGKNPDGNLTYGEDRIGHSDLIRSALQPVDIPRRGIDEHESTK